MARRTDDRERVVRRTIHYCFDRRQHAARRQHRGLIGVGRGVSVGVEIITRHRGAAFDLGHVGGVVTQFDLGDARLARTKREYCVAMELFGHLDHHRGAFGALGMASAGEMFQKTAVTD